MKAFKEWWRAYWLTDSCRSDRDLIPAKLAWKAALEQVSCKIQEEKFKTGSVDMQDAYDTIEKYIQEELEQ